MKTLNKPVIQKMQTRRRLEPDLDIFLGILARILGFGFILAALVFVVLGNIGVL